MLAFEGEASKCSGHQPEESVFFFVFFLLLVLLFFLYRNMKPFTRVTKCLPNTQAGGGGVRVCVGVGEGGGVRNALCALCCGSKPTRILQQCASSSSCCSSSSSSSSGGSSCCSSSNSCCCVLIVLPSSSLSDADIILSLDVDVFYWAFIVNVFFYIFLRVLLIKNSI